MAESVSKGHCDTSHEGKTLTRCRFFGPSVTFCGSTSDRTFLYTVLLDIPDSMETSALSLWQLASSSAPRCVMLHGFAGAPECWARVRSLVPEITTVAPHLPGHHPQAPVADSFEANVQWLADLLRLQEAWPAHLVAHGLGARLALALAVRHPKKVLSLTLMSCHPGLELAPERQQRRQTDRRWVDLLRRDGQAAFVAAWERQPLFASQRLLDSARVAGHRATRLQHEPESLARVIETMGLAEMPDYTGAIAKLPMPVTVVTGMMDPRFMSISRSIVAQAPDVQFMVLDAGHDLPLEAPELVADIVRQSCYRPCRAEVG